MSPRGLPLRGASVPQETFKNPEAGGAVPLRSPEPLPCPGVPAPPCGPALFFEREPEVSSYSWADESLKLLHYRECRQIQSTGLVIPPAPRLQCLLVPSLLFGGEVSSHGGEHVIHGDSVPELPPISASPTRYLTPHGLLHESSGVCELTGTGPARRGGPAAGWWVQCCWASGRKAEGGRGRSPASSGGAAVCGRGSGPDFQVMTSRVPLLPLHLHP